MGSWTLAQRVAASAGLALIGAGALHGVVFLLDDQPWAGPLGWRKAITFGLSFGATLLTFAVLARWVRFRGREELWVLGSLTAAAVLEYVLITVQAWRGEPSHFNVATPLDAAIWVGMGVGIAAVVVATIAFAVVAFRPLDAGPALSLGIRAGTVLLLAGYVVGGAILANGGGVSTSPTGHESMLGASGELKVPHAVGLHAFQALPAIAWFAGRITRNRRTQTRVVALAAGVWSVLLLAQLAFALAGRAAV